MSTCRRPALDFLRDLAMLAVMLIHVTSTYIAAESHVTFLGMNLALFLNQASGSVYRCSCFYPAIP